MLLTALRRAAKDVCVSECTALAAGLAACEVHCNSVKGDHDTPEQHKFLLQPVVFKVAN